MNKKRLILLTILGGLVTIGAGIGIGVAIPNKTNFIDKGIIVLNNYKDVYMPLLWIFISFFALLFLIGMYTIYLKENNKSNKIFNFTFNLWWILFIICLFILILFLVFFILGQLNKSEEFLNLKWIIYQKEYFNTLNIKLPDNFNEWSKFVLPSDTTDNVLKHWQKILETIDYATKNNLKVI